MKQDSSSKETEVDNSKQEYVSAFRLEDYYPSLRPISKTSGERKTLSEAEGQKLCFFQRYYNHYDDYNLEYIDCLRAIVFSKRWEKRGGFLGRFYAPTAIQKMREVMAWKLIIISDIQIASELCKIASNESSDIANFAPQVQEMMQEIADWTSVKDVAELRGRIDLLYKKCQPSDDLHEADALQNSCGFQPES